MKYIQFPSAGEFFHKIFPFTTLPVFLHFISILLFLIAIAIPIIIVASIFHVYFLLKRIITQESIFLELTPPVFTEKTAYTTQKLFSVIHSMGEESSFLHWFFGIKTNFSFEIVSTREKGIRYIIRTTPNESESLKHNITSYLPSVRIREVSDYISNSKEVQKPTILEFKLKRKFPLPLAKQQILTEHDPVAYITGMMTNLKPQDLMALQVVISPSSINTKALSQRIERLEDVLPELVRSEQLIYAKVISGVFTFLLFPAFGLIRDIFNWLLDFVMPTNQRSGQLVLATYQNQMIDNKQKPARVITMFEQQMMQSVKEKIDQSLFEATVRVFIQVRDKKETRQRVQGVKSCFAPFRVPMYQELIPNSSFPILGKKLRLFSFQKRILSSFTNRSSSLFSVSEIADLYHFPFSKTSKTEDLVRTKETRLPSPLSLKQELSSGVTIGKNIYGDAETLIKLPETQRKESMYMIGGSGMGKTTILANMIFQDMLSGKGLCLLDPHGDLTKQLLSIVPEDRIKDVVYINPLDTEYVVGFNMLSPMGVSIKTQEEQERIVSSVLSIFQKQTGKDYWGPRLEHILRNALLTSFAIDTPTPIPTLYTVQLLLTDKTFRKQITEKLIDPVLKRFWNKEFGLYGDMQLASVISPITNKIGKFITNQLTRHILLQEKSTINISQIMDEGKILLVNLSKGELGEDRSFFFGTMITSLIQLAAYERAKLSENNRRDFYLYIDEFQNFATNTFTEIVSETKKFHIYPILSHQNTAQIEDKDLLKIILGNVGTLISLRTSPDDEAVVLPFFAPEVSQGDLVNLKPHQFVIKIRSEKLEDAFTGETVVLDEQESSKTTEEIIKQNRRQYAKSVEEVEKELQKVFSVDTKEPSVNDKKPLKKNKKTKKV